ncbi:MAG TPA: hypothetical protein VFW11_12095 [Cyclobacteriaceae bacterium]|nr:hypothetical protein [Cyclobacteriaceae bacterium]
MKTLRSSSPYLVKALPLVMLITLTNCSEPIGDQVAPPPSTLPSDLWESLSDPSNLISSVVVQQGASLQNAIEAAEPGQVIYLEPGLYREPVIINKEHIKLIGLNGAHGEKVVISSLELKSKAEVINVFRHNDDVPLKDIETFFQPDDYELNNVFSSPQLTGGRRNLISKSFYCLFGHVKRTELANGIAHYEFEIPLGHGSFDIVRLHRVVRESRPYRPIRTEGDVFMVHGASQDFDDIFLTAGSNNPDAQTSSPIYLAGKNIDVWGIDLAWTLVPKATTDFSFMKDWGVQRDVNHTLAGLSIARLVRGLTGQSFAPMNLLGFSYGVAIAYTAAGQETQKFPLLRNVKGIIPVDSGMKFETGDEVSRHSACTEAANIKTSIDGGKYQGTLGLDIAPIAALASTAPNDPSPIPAFAGLTNIQVAMAIGSSPAANPVAPYWHFVGGSFSALLYTDEVRWVNLLNVLAPYQPQLTSYEYRVCVCDEEESYLDDHLNEIAVPILYLGAGGGFGSLGNFTTNLTASTDITTYTVNKQSAADRNIDYGHADLWMATNASNDVWDVLRQWLVDHHH